MRPPRAYDEFLDDSQLEQMPIKKVLKLRTKIWKNHAEAREKLFESVSQLADEIENDDEFESQCRVRIQESRTISEALERERRFLRSRIFCDLGELAPFFGKGIRNAVIMGGIATGFQSLVHSPFSMETTLVLAAAGAVQPLTEVVGQVSGKVKNYFPEYLKYKAKKQELKRGAGFGLDNYFRRLR